MKAKKQWISVVELFYLLFGLLSVVELFYLLLGLLYVATHPRKMATLYREDKETKTL